MRPFLHVGNHFVTHFQREEYLVLEQKLLKRTVCTCSSRSCSFLCLRASSCSFTSEPASVISAWLHPGARQRRLYVYTYHVHARVRALQLVQPPLVLLRPLIAQLNMITEVSVMLGWNLMDLELLPCNSISLLFP